MEPRYHGRPAGRDGDGRSSRSFAPRTPALVPIVVPTPSSISTDSARAAGGPTHGCREATSHRRRERRGRWARLDGHRRHRWPRREEQVHIGYLGGGDTTTRLTPSTRSTPATLPPCSWLPARPRWSPESFSGSRPRAPISRSGSRADVSDWRVAFESSRSPDRTPDCRFRHSGDWMQLHPSASRSSTQRLPTHPLATAQAIRRNPTHETQASRASRRSTQGARTLASPARSSAAVATSKRARRNRWCVPTGRSRQSARVTTCASDTGDRTVSTNDGPNGLFPTMPWIMPWALQTSRATKTMATEPSRTG